MHLKFYFEFFKTSRNKPFSTKMDKFSTVALHPLVRTLTGLSTLYVLTKPYIFPGASTHGSINVLELYLKLYFLFTFERINS